MRPRSLALLTIASALATGGATNLTAWPGEAAKSVKLVAPDGQPGDGFGSSVAVDGDTVVVGAWEDETGAGEDAGSAYVFVRSPKGWLLQQKIEAPGATPGARFGAGVAVQGDTLVVGAPLAASPSAYVGAVYVYARWAGTWVFSQKLMASDAAGGDLFGWHLSLSDNMLLVGAHGKDTAAGSAAGAAYLFERPGKVWGQVAKLEAPDGADTDCFGWDVSLHGLTAVVGSSGADGRVGENSGAAYVFARTSHGWTLQQRIVAAVQQPGARFGDTVAVFEGTVMVGAPRADTSLGEDSGAAYVFARTSNGWKQVQMLTAPGGMPEDLFGADLALGHDVAVVGAGYEDTAMAADAGAAYVFARSGKGWAATRRLSVVEGQDDDHFGANLALSPELIVVGTHHADSSAGVDAGAAYITSVH
jgi:hypothetical protein